MKLTLKPVRRFFWRLRYTYSMCKIIGATAANVAFAWTASAEDWRA